MEVEDKTSALIINRCDMRLNATKKIIEYYNDDEDFNKIVLSSTIPARVNAMNTETELVPINFTEPESVACDAFRNVISELRERMVL